jgi:hypothetical protein
MPEQQSAVVRQISLSGLQPERYWHVGLGAPG